MSPCPPPPDGPLTRARRIAGGLRGFLTPRVDGDPVAAFALRALDAALALGAIYPSERVAPLTTWTEARAAWGSLLAILGAEDERDLASRLSVRDADGALSDRASAGALSDLGRRAARVWSRAIERSRPAALSLAPENDCTEGTTAPMLDPDLEALRARVKGALEETSLHGLDLALQLRRAALTGTLTPETRAEVEGIVTRLGALRAEIDRARTTVAIAAAGGENDAAARLPPPSLRLVRGGRAR